MSSLKAVFCGIAALLLAGPQPASAQIETHAYSLEDALQICARIPDSTDALACFKDLARKAEPGSSEETAPLAGEKAPEGSLIAPAPQVGTENGKSRYVIMRADDYEREKSKTTEPTPSTREIYEAVVLRAWRYSNGEYHIALTNGEIWKSQASDTPRPVRDGEKVELHPGAVGGWFMQFKTIKRPTIRVTLVK